MKLFIAHFLFVALVLPFLSHGQTALDGYIKHGLENNRMLKERNINLEQGMLALKEAKSYFLPSVNFIGNYTTADGGRVINLPLGDLVNPAYAALNQLTGSNAFPTLENRQEQFLPRNFYDARVRVSYPLYNNDMYTNRSVKSQSVQLEAYEVEIYRHELIKEIKQAYYNYCIASDALSIYQNALTLLQQNLKVSRSLLTNGKGLPAQVLRAESELEQVNAQLAMAESRQMNARQYLNFLINRPLGEPVVYENQPFPAEIAEVVLEEPNVQHRLELRKIDAAIGINHTLLKANKNFVVPRLSSFMDFGSQGFDFEYNNQSRYYLLGIQMDMPIFNGNRNRLKINQSKLAIGKLENTRAHVSEQLQLAALTAQNQLRAAMAAFTSAEKQLKSANTYLELINRGYEEGVNSLIEFIDARNQLTNASMQKNIAYYQVLSAYADYQRQTSIPQNHEN